MERHWGLPIHFYMRNLREEGTEKMCGKAAGRIVKRVVLIAFAKMRLCRRIFAPSASCCHRLQEKSIHLRALSSRFAACHAEAVRSPGAKHASRVPPCQGFGVAGGDGCGT